MNRFLSEFRQAIRALLRAPGFTVPIVAVLGLGLGANLALHAILQTVLFRPLPVTEPARLVNLVALAQDSWEAPRPLSYPQLQVVRATAAPFQSLAAAIPEPVRMVVDGAASPRTAAFVDPDWFATLGVRPALGRLFSPDEAGRGEPVAVLGYALWRDRFHKDPGILGRTLELNGHPVRVLGVAAPAFEGLDIQAAQELWLPLAARAALIAVEPGEDPRAFLDDWEYCRFQVTGRLRAGASLAQAAAALAVAAHDIQAVRGRLIIPGFRIGTEDLRRGRDRLLDEFLPQRPLLFGASTLALLLAVVAAAGLIAARAERQRRQPFIRAALGGTGWDLARPMLLESVIVALLTVPVALAVGLLLARHFMTMPGSTPLEQRLLPSLDPRLVATALGLALATLLAAVLGPLLACRRLDLGQALRQQSAQGGSRSGGQLFVVAQVALSMALLAAASVALGGLRRAATVGFPVDHRAILKVDPGVLPREGLAERLRSRIQALPGVRSVALAARAPLEALPIPFRLRGEREDYSFPAAVVGPDWFRTLGVPLVEGREFNPGDGKSVVILNQAMARRLFPGGPATGRVIRGASKTLEVIGVVQDHRQWVDPDPHQPILYLAWPWWFFPDFTLVVAGQGPAQARVPMLAQALECEAPGLAPVQLLTLEDHLDRVLRKEHQNLRLLGLLGFGSLLLASFGLWAALNLHVALRWRELGIRAALGATARQLAARILTLGGRMLALGLGAGGLLVWGLARFAAARWPGLPALALLDLMLAAGVLAGSATLACLLPALRASRVAPAEALRSE
jgi:predicted permease